MGMTDRQKLEALVWRRVSNDLKVTASGMRFVSVGGKLVTLDSLCNNDLFGVLRRTSVVNVITKALEAA